MNIPNSVRALGLAALTTVSVACGSGTPEGAQASYSEPTQPIPDAICWQNEFQLPDGTVFTDSGQLGLVGDSESILVCPDKELTRSGEIATAIGECRKWQSTTSCEIR